MIEVETECGFLCLGVVVLAALLLGVLKQTREPLGVRELIYGVRDPAITFRGERGLLALLEALQLLSEPRTLA